MVFGGLFAVVSFLVILGLMSDLNTVDILLKGLQKLLNSSMQLIIIGGRSLTVQLNGPEMKRMLSDTNVSDQIIEL